MQLDKDDPSQVYQGKQGDHHGVQNRRARRDVCPCHSSGNLRSRGAAAGTVSRIGLLAGNAQTLREQHATETLATGLAGTGYAEGKNIILEYRYTEGNVALLSGLAAALVRLNIDLIVVTGSGGAGVLAAKQGTTTTPILMVGVATDPVETGLVESLARPGGNITGSTNLTITGSTNLTIKEKSHEHRHSSIHIRRAPI